MNYRLIADLILIMHVAYVAFVILGLALVLIGGVCSWQWVRNPWFRYLHLISIGIVVLQSWLDFTCPLTSLEMYCRAKVGDLTYEGTFIAHWFHQLLYFDAPPWCFTMGYTFFGFIVVGSWFGVRPRPIRLIQNSNKHRGSGHGIADEV